MLVGEDDFRPLLRLTSHEPYLHGFLANMFQIIVWLMIHDGLLFKFNSFVYKNFRPLLNPVTHLPELADRDS